MTSFLQDDPVRAAATAAAPLGEARSPLEKEDPPVDKTGRTRGETAARVNLVAKVLESRENILLDPLEGEEG